ncbi:hypothetical protein CEP52_017302 [Fusarium oligoseptatum]|uniref:Uncharacterized protein n=1 Tax=Fusarium oligoseptatum TaxID=2604345 RepID=A0A428RTJ3_9HYPO|nr:hypothetical protein CEP52_017302 [Fusarium oligoseptatum]
MSNRTPQTNTPNRESSSKESLYTGATPIRFASRSTGGDVLILDPRNVQQWQLDAYQARLDEQMAKYKDRVQELESFIENSVSNKVGDQIAVKEELEMLKAMLGMDMLGEHLLSLWGGSMMNVLVLDCSVKITD